MTIIPLDINGQRQAAGRARIAVIGSGISGSSAAWALASENDVTVFEANSKPGGHTATVDINYDGKPVAVDTGFIVYNEHNYPNLTALFSHLGVTTQASNMSFALSLDHGRLEWSGASYTSLFAQKRNVISLPFLMMLREVLRFNSSCVADRNSGYTANLSIGTYLQKRQFSARFMDDYLIPMAAAIWSTPRVKMLDFPADAFISFFENHRLIHTERPDWRTVTGGSRNYLDKLLATPGITLRCNSPVSKVHRSNGKVYVTLETGVTEVFDGAVMACHSDQAYRMLGDASDLERKVLGSVGYRPNRVILHRDPSLMPKRKRAWSAWNYLRSSKPGGEPEVAVTYWMNRLQGIDEKMPLFITLNPPHEPKAGSVFGEWSYDHPQFDAQAIEAQGLLPQIQGGGNVWFAGAWTGFGFHEDGLRSGLEVAVQLGARLPFALSQSRIRRVLAAAE
ncbi:MAG: NAD(P)/FAD-dependent oxidoreductase [Rhizobiaceae bacterium]